MTKKVSPPLIKHEQLFACFIRETQPKREILCDVTYMWSLQKLSS